MEVMQCDNIHCIINYVSDNHCNRNILPDSRGNKHIIGFRRCNCCRVVSLLDYQNNFEEEKKKVKRERAF